jgi:uncharacterized protein with HEPN domain
MRSDRERLLDILEAIDHIEKHADVDKSAFEVDELLQTWMVHHIQIIGEAAAAISSEFQAQHREVPWRSVASMRNAIVHEYFRVDLDEVWSVISNDLPALKQSVAALAEDCVD